MAMNIVEVCPDTAVLAAVTMAENYAAIPPVTQEGLLQTRCGDRRLAYMGGVGLWGAAQEIAIARMIAGDAADILGALSDPHTTIQRVVHDTCAADAGVPDFLANTLTEPRTVALTDILTRRLGEARGVPSHEWASLVARYRNEMDDRTNGIVASLMASHQPGAALDVVANHKDGVIIETPDAKGSPRAVVIDTSASGVLRAGVTDGTLYHHNGNVLHASANIPPDIAIAAQRWVGAVAAAIAYTHGLPIYLASGQGHDGRTLEEVIFT